MKTDDPILTAYALGESLSPQERHRVEAAAAADPEIRDAIEAIRKTGELLDAALADEPMPVPGHPPQAARAPQQTPPKWRPGQHLSPSARKARIARFEKEAPVLGGLSRKTGSKTNYGAYGAIIAACLALVGLTVFRTVADRFEQMEADSHLVEVEPLNPEDLEFDSPLAQIIAQQVADEMAEQEALELALSTELAAADFTADLTPGTNGDLPTLAAFRMSERFLDEPLPPAPPAIGTGLSETRITARHLIPASEFRPELPEGVEMAAVRSEPEPLAIPYPDRPRISSRMEISSIEVIPDASRNEVASDDPLAGLRFTEVGDAHSRPIALSEILGDSSLPVAMLQEDPQPGEPLALAAAIERYQAPLRARIASDSYAVASARGFVSPAAAPYSSFPLEVDTRSYANIRHQLHRGERPPADAIQIGEWVNFFRYAQDAAPQDSRPVSVELESAAAPWADQHQLVRVVIMTPEAAAGQDDATVRDVDVQVRFNPQQVKAYRLIGYEDIALHSSPAEAAPRATLDAGTQITALYEVVPVGVEWEQGEGPAYQQIDGDAFSTGNDLLTVEVRYATARTGERQLLARALPTRTSALQWTEASDDFRWVAAVAGFGMLLQESDFRGGADWNMVDNLARSALGEDPDGLRRDFLQLIHLARSQSDARSTGDEG